MITKSNIPRYISGLIVGIILIVFGVTQIHYMLPPANLDAVPNQFRIGFEFLFVTVVGGLLTLICLAMLIVELTGSHKRNLERSNNSVDKIT